MKSNRETGVIVPGTRHLSTSDVIPIHSVAASRPILKLDSYDGVAPSVRGRASAECIRIIGTRFSYVNPWLAG